MNRKTTNRGTLLRRGSLVGALAVLAAVGCNRDNPYKLAGDGQAGEDCPPISGSSTQTTGSGNNPTGGSGAGGPSPTELTDREVDYGEALRTASLKLMGTLPTLEQIYELDDTPEDQQAAKYEELIDEMLSSPRFSMRMIEYWRNVFKMQGDGTMAGHPTRESAPTFAAQLVVENRSFQELLLATSGTCPTYDAQSNTFTAGECSNTTPQDPGAIPVTVAGVLTDPGIHSLYVGNLAFRRNRFYHEVFLCRDGNAPGGAEPTDMPNLDDPCAEVKAPGNYTSPWPMSSIAGECNNAPVNFHEYNTTVVCANCHATWNHRAPLFGNFDEFGEYFDSPQVPVPVEGSPLATREDWLPPGEATAWKFGMPAANLTELGNVMAADPEVQACAVKRMWNYAMSRGDIVDNETPVPSTVIASLTEAFVANDFKMKDLLKQILLSDDYVSF